MITKEQATAQVPWVGPGGGVAWTYDANNNRVELSRDKYEDFHYEGCHRKRGPRGGVEHKVEKWRRNGATKTWKKAPERFRIPIKHGMRDYHYIDETNAHLFHLPEDCPLNKMTDEEYAKAEGIPV